MALFDMFNPVKRPIGGTPVLPEAEMRARLMSLNRATSPWRVIDGRTEQVDYVVEWKISDAEWREIFGKARTTFVFRIGLKLDPSTSEVNGIDNEYNVEWSGGVPDLRSALSGSHGPRVSVSSAAAYKFIEEIRPYQVHNYHFITEELKKPIQDAITSSGWTYKGKL